MLVGHIADGQNAKVRQPGFRANGRELGIIYDDFVSHKLVWPSLDLGEIGIETRLGMYGRVARCFGHPDIVNSICTKAPNGATICASICPGGASKLIGST